MTRQLLHSFVFYLLFVLLWLSGGCRGLEERNSAKSLGDDDPRRSHFHRHASSSPVPLATSTTKPHTQRRSVNEVEHVTTSESSHFSSSSVQSTASGARPSASMKKKKMPAMTGETKQDQDQDGEMVVEGKEGVRGMDDVAVEPTETREEEGGNAGSGVKKNEEGEAGSWVKGVVQDLLGDFDED